MWLRMSGIVMGLVVSGCGTDALMSTGGILDEIVEIQRQERLEEDHRRLENALAITREDLRSRSADPERGWWCFEGHYRAVKLGKCTRTLDACAKGLARAEELGVRFASGTCFERPLAACYQLARDSKDESGPSSQVTVERRCFPETRLCRRNRDRMLDEGPVEPQGCATLE